jgi:gamma-glutamylcyclotransferase (GGCT)/AIG2-like uncharacterized protein YtfP
MSSYLFAYGSLQPGYVPGEMAHSVAKLMIIDRGYAKGALYDLGGYPGAILDPSSEQRIAGIVLRLPEDADLLRELDAYEEFDPDAPGSSPFLRILRPIELASGGTLQCWVYVYNRDPGSAPVIPDGRFRKRR